MSAAKKPAGKKPKTLGDMVVAALVTLNDRPPGSSRQAIKNFIKAEFGKDDKAGALKRAITKLVDSKKLAQTGQSFMLVGDATAGAVKFASVPQYPQMEHAKQGGVFWWIVQRGKKTCATYGNIGAGTKSSEKTHASESSAAAFVTTMIGEKIEGGYEMVTDAAPKITGEEQFDADYALWQAVNAGDVGAAQAAYARGATANFLCGALRVWS